MRCKFLGVCLASFLSLALPAVVEAGVFARWFHHGPPLPPNDYSPLHTWLPEVYSWGSWHRPQTYTYPVVPYPYVSDHVIVTPQPSVEIVPQQPKGNGPIPDNR